MSLVITVVIIGWFFSALIRSAEAKRQAKWRAKVEAEQRKRKQAQAEERREIMRLAKEQEREAKEWARQQVEIQREQMRLAKEQQRQAEQLAKHEEQLRKHDEQIAKLQFQIEQAQADIEAERERINGLYALLDIAAAQQAAATPGSKADEAAQRKVISLTGQIAAAEKRIRKAEYTKAAAEKKLAA